ncbi:MAG: hypothetical protein U9O97_04925 [Elusimicrobiota bacterium]|nr:hypothetical protein [Elusimicrobiota bacterium]
MNIMKKGDVHNKIAIFEERKGAGIMKKLWTSPFSGVIAALIIVSSFQPLSAGAGAFAYKAAPKIITPGNSDGRNDVFFVFYMNLDSQSSLSGKIFNLMGMKAADMVNTGGAGVILAPPPGGWHPLASAAWEGYLKWTPSGGISPGIYIWQVEAEGQVYTGTVVVVK